MASRGEARQGKARIDLFVDFLRCAVMRCMAGPGWAWPGEARHGRAWLGNAMQGSCAAVLLESEMKSDLEDDAESFAEFQAAMAADIRRVNEQSIRMRCLQEAVRFCLTTSGEPLDLAQKYYDWICTPLSEMPVERRAPKRRREGM